MKKFVELLAVWNACGDDEAVDVSAGFVVVVAVLWCRSPFFLLVRVCVIFRRKVLLTGWQSIFRFPSNFGCVGTEHLLYGNPSSLSS